MRPHRRLGTAGDGTDWWQVASLPCAGSSPQGHLLAGSGVELEELSRTRDEAEDRARELLAAEALHAARNGYHDERARQLVLAVRRDLLTELRSQEQEQAGRQLAAARTAARTPSPGSCRA